MGKKKRHVTDEVHEIPIFYAKKAKVMLADNELTSLSVLHKYCSKFKLGNPGFRQKRENPFVITCVMDGQELGTAQHADKDTAMEKSSLLTLHLLDPDGKSVCANLTHPDENTLKRLATSIANAKVDEAKFIPAEYQSAMGMQPGAMGAMGGMGSGPMMPHGMGLGGPMMGGPPGPMGMAMGMAPMGGAGPPFGMGMNGMMMSPTLVPMPVPPAPFAPRPGMPAMPPGMMQPSIAGMPPPGAPGLGMLPGGPGAPPGFPGQVPPGGPPPPGGAAGAPGAGPPGGAPPLPRGPPGPAPPPMAGYAMPPGAAPGAPAAAPAPAPAAPPLVGTADEDINLVYSDESVSMEEARALHHRYARTESQQAQAMGDRLSSLEGSIEQRLKQLTGQSK